MGPDPSICRSLATAIGQGFSIAQADARNDVLRRHFYDLTLAFLHPFLSHLNAGMRGSVARADADTSWADFDEEYFLQELQPVGVFGSMPRSRCQDLYGRFIRGANFQPFLKH